MQYAEITRVGPLAPRRARFVPWHVPAWLPVEAEGPATFLVGVLGGLLIAFFVSTIAGFIGSLAHANAPDEAPTSSRAPATLESGARALVITRPASYAGRAVADLDAPPAVPAAAPLRARPLPLHKTAVARPMPKRDVLLAAALTP